MPQPKILSVATVAVLLTGVILVYISIRYTNRLNMSRTSLRENHDFLNHLQHLSDEAIFYEEGADTGRTASQKAALEKWTVQLTEINQQRNHIPSSNMDSLVAAVKNTSSSPGNIPLTGSIQPDNNNNKSASENTREIRHWIDKVRKEAITMQDLRQEQFSKEISGLGKWFYAIMALGICVALVIIEWTRRSMRKQLLNEQKFISLLDAAPDATVIVNGEGKIQLVNQQAEKLFGYSRTELIGQPVEILIPGELRNRHTKHRDHFTREANRRPMGAGIELLALKKNKETFPVEISLSPVKTADGQLVSASIRDISERKKSADKFRALLDAAPDATVIVNEAGIIQLINHQTENLFRYTREELIGQPVEILIPADLRHRHAGHRDGFVKAAKVRSMGEGFELNAIKKDGTSFAVEISLSPIQTEDGMLVSASVRDISLRKKLETELKKTNAELEAFTYSVSHDLRAPLRGIIGFTSILEEDYTNQLDAEARRITGIIKDNTQKMAHLIDDLLSFSRMGKQEIIKSLIDSNLLIDDIINGNLIQHKTENSINWQINPLPAVWADLTLIRQVWINLLSNAVKYSSLAKEPRIEIGTSIKDGFTIFYIRDNGVGFDEQYKEKLFKVFQRLHSAEEFEGTGVGLALVEKIVTRHGGRVWADGSVGKGACFYFSLPVQAS